MDTKSLHVIAEFWDCEVDLTDVGFLRDHMVVAANEANANPINIFANSFTPPGVTVLIAVEESHLSIHTWPVEKYAAIDIFTCGDNTDPDKAIDYLRYVLNPQTVHVARVERGNKNIGITFVNEYCYH